MVNDSKAKMTVLNDTHPDACPFGILLTALQWCVLGNCQVGHMAACQNPRCVVAPLAYTTPAVVVMSHFRGVIKEVIAQADGGVKGCALGLIDVQAGVCRSPMVGPHPAIFAAVAVLYPEPALGKRAPWVHGLRTDSGGSILQGKPCVTASRAVMVAVFLQTARTVRLTHEGEDIINGIQPDAHSTDCPRFIETCLCPDFAFQLNGRAINS